MRLLDEPVLVLNKYYLAIQVTTAREAIKALVNGKATVVDQNYVTYDMERWGEQSLELNNGHPDGALYPGILRSQRISFMVPQVIVEDCEFNSSIKREVRYSRKNVYQRDDYTCQYCHKKFTKSNLTLDHVVPRSRGGTTGWNNVVTSCERCNGKKKDKLLSELGWALRTEPGQPRWKSHIGTPFNKEKKDYWNQFLR